jgi:hypothetical protein
MLPSRPSFVIGMNVFKEVWTAHGSLGSLGISSRGQTRRFHTPGFVQGMEAKFDEHIRVANVF